MARPSSAVNTQTSIITINSAGVEVFVTDGWASVAPGSSFITPVALAIASTPLADRKSTRLNSSHGYISYAVFCLKKKELEHLPEVESSLKRTPLFLYHHLD